MKLNLGEKHVKRFKKEMQQDGFDYDLFDFLDSIHSKVYSNDFNLNNYEKEQK